MRKLAKSLIVILPAFLAGFVAWLFLPCQPERSVSVPAGTKLVEFSRTGRYVVTCQGNERRLTLWRTDTGQATYEAEIPYPFDSNVWTHMARALYGFSVNDSWLAVATAPPDGPRLVIVDLTSGNTVTPIAEPLPGERPLPRPAFSSNRRYLSYLIRDDQGQWWAILYDIAENREQLRVPGVSNILVPPTTRGKWLLSTANEIELWDAAQRQREATLTSLASWPLDWRTMGLQGGQWFVGSSLTPDEEAFTALCFVWNPSRKEHIALHRCDLTTRKIETVWEHELPPVETPLWSLRWSEPTQFLLIKTRDDDGHLVEDLLDVATGKVLARYLEPIDMVESANLPGLTLSLGRTGQIAIDSERRVIVSRWIIRDSFFWKYFGTPLGWVGIRPGPPRLCLQFHSAETGRLLERFPLQTADLSNPRELRLTLHPSEPLLAVIDEDGSNLQLQFWRVPPPRPWAWIAACALAAGGFAWLVWIGYSKIRKRKSEAIIQPDSSTGSLTPATPGG